MSMIFRLTKKIQDIMNGVIGIALIAIVLIVLLQTFTRCVVFYSLPWSEELSRYLFTLLILFGVNIGIGQDSLVRMDLLDGLLTEKVKRLLLIVRHAAAAVISGVYFYMSFGIVRIGTMRTSPAMGIRMSYIYMILVIGFGLAFFCAIVKTVEVIMKKGGE